MKRPAISLLFFLAAGMVTLASPAVAEDPIPLTQPLHGYYTYGTQAESPPKRPFAQGRPSRRFRWGFTRLLRAGTAHLYGRCGGP